MDLHPTERVIWPNPPPPWDVRLKVRDVIKLVERDGWLFVGQKGSHRQFEHPEKSGRVTISGHPGDDMPRGTLKSVLRQARLRRKAT